MWICPTGVVINETYRIEGFLNKGGMSTLYRAVHLSSGSQVVFKFLTCPSESDSADSSRHVLRFRREVKILRRLQHPNIVRVLDFGEVNPEKVYLVMELLEGSNLAYEIKRCGGLTPLRCARIAGYVCAALGEAHRQDIIHRDLKPSNVFLAVQPGGGEVVKILDFGIAKVLNADTSALTRSGDILGTPHYMAPEQFIDEPVGAYTDLYALGAMLFRMLTGSHLFAGESWPLIGHQHLHSPPPTLILPGQPSAMVERWRALLARLLAKAPNERPVDAGVVADDLLVLAQLHETSGVDPMVDKYNAARSTAATPDGDSDPTRLTNDPLT